MCARVLVYAIRLVYELALCKGIRQVELFRSVHYRQLRNIKAWFHNAELDATERSHVIWPQKHIVSDIFN